MTSGLHDYKSTVSSSCSLSLQLLTYMYRARSSSDNNFPSGERENLAGLPSRSAFRALMRESRDWSKFLLIRGMRFLGMHKNCALDFQAIDLGLGIQKQVKRKCKVLFELVS